MAARPLYRARQFFQAVGAQAKPQVTADEWQTVARLLTPEALALFRGMSAAGQRHSLNVLRALQAQGHDAPALLVAALLHDVAKSDRVRVWHRVAVVLVKAARPAWLQTLASPDPHSWRYPFYLHLHHPRRGAAQAQAAGCSPDAVALIRRHQDAAPTPPQSQLDAWLLALQAADETY